MGSLAMLVHMKLLSLRIVGNIVTVECSADRSPKRKLTRRALAACLTSGERIRVSSLRQSVVFFALCCHREHTPTHLIFNAMHGKTRHASGSAHKVTIYTNIRLTKSKRGTIIEVPLSAHEAHMLWTSCNCCFFLHALKQKSILCKAAASCQPIKETLKSTDQYTKVHMV